VRIEILGVGCSKCKMLEANARRAVAEKNLNIEIVKIVSMEEILRYGVLSTPALAIDGHVMCSGRIASAEEIKKWL
jgi:small redox-active disulfide protein 2